MPLVTTVAPHPSLRLRAFEAVLPAPVAEIGVPGWLRELLDPAAATPIRRTGEDADRIRREVRDLLRHGGYKPTGRGKPASEYLAKAAAGDGLRSINLAVDLCNAVSLHSGIPISVVDLDRTEPPLEVAIAPPGSSYVFNPTGQEIDVAGLLCLADADGPCANAVKDSMRTKTHDGTVRIGCLVWGARSIADEVDAAAAWYRELTERAGARIASVDPPRPEA